MSVHRFIRRVENELRPLGRPHLSGGNRKSMTLFCSLSKNANLPSQSHSSVCCITHSTGALSLSLSHTTTHTHTLQYTHYTHHPHTAIFTPTRLNKHYTLIHTHTIPQCFPYHYIRGAPRPPLKIKFIVFN